MMIEALKEELNKANSDHQNSAKDLNSKLKQLEVYSN